ncbi:MAG: hypothetical protein KKB31_01475 [Nanoarchaeota archaeon]|nr:hypothetical protein [Nanoarchaeota archaeon]
MRNSIFITLGLALLTLVLMGVTLIEPLDKIYPNIETFAPMIVICGFFTFLVSVGLFLCGLINILKKK